MLPTIATGNVGSALAGEYEVSNSLRFNDDSNDYLTRTFSAGNRKTWSFSTWIKRSNLINANMNILGTDYTSLGEAYLLFRSGEQLMYGQYEGGGASNNYSFQTNQAFRDTSAWYNILFVWDTTQSTSSDRMKLYVNGSQITSFSSSSYPSLNLDGVWNSGRVHYIGDATYGTNLDGYLCETVFVDGTALTPTDVGEFDEDSPTIWKPIDVSGLTFGTNGFYLDFENASSLGADVSGNSNNFTVNNLTSIDQSTDTCTNNFATWNPLEDFYFSGVYSEGNTKVVTNGSKYSFNQGTIGVNSGKWYFEIEPTAKGSGSSDLMIGISSSEPTANSNYLGQNANDYGYRGNGNKRTGGSESSYGNSYDVNNIIGVALDLDNNKLYFSKDGVFQNSGDPTTGSTGTGAISITDPASTVKGFYFPSVSYIHDSQTATYEANFGNPSVALDSGNTDANGHGNFEYAVPSGYFALCTKNLAEFG